MQSIQYRTYIYHKTCIIIYQQTLINSTENNNYSESTDIR